MDSSIIPYIGNKGTLKKIISRVRKEGPVEPNNLDDDLSIPNEYRNTLSGEQFLLKESSIGDGKILLFSTCFNLKKLEKTPFWIMYGIFKTVPTAFKQLYTIHAPIGPHERSRLLPLVYVLISRKNTECYIQ